MLQHGCKPEGWTASNSSRTVTVIEAMPWAGGQIRLAVRNLRRIDLIGIVDWRVSELERLGVEVRYDTFADAPLVLSLEPDVVIVATGGLPQLPDLESGVERVVTSWDVLVGDVMPTGRVLFYDDNGTHSALSAAEMIARSGADLEIVTPERMFGIEVGGLNHVPYARAFNEADTRISINQRVLTVEPDADGLRVEVGSDHSDHRSSRLVEHVIVDHGTQPLDELYFDLKPSSSNLGAVDYEALIDGRPQTVDRNDAGSFQLFRIGDAIAGRNIHAAIYDALRLVKDL